MNHLLDFHDVPHDVLQAAARVNTWMKAEGHEKWELMDLCSRNHADELRRVKMAMETIKLQKPEMDGWFSRSVKWLKSLD